jgi:hypothetical protein
MLVHRNDAKLGAFLIVVFATSIGIWMFAASYFGIEILPSLSFPASDGHCIPSSQGVGSHCFGDYYYPLNIAKQQSPWHGYNPYPAAPMSIFKIFVWLENLTNSSRFGLATYLFLNILAIATPAIWISRSMGLRYGATIFVLSGPFSYAGMIALDRGNLVGLIPPLLLLFLVGLKNNNFNYAHFGVIGSAIIKPQFAVLALVFILISEYRSFFVSIRMVALTQLLPFLLWPNSFINNIPKSLKMMLQFNSNDEPVSLYPPQISIQMSFRVLADLLEATSSVQISNLNISSLILDSAEISLFLSVFAVLFIYRRRFSIVVMGAYLIIVVTLLPGTVYNYYLVVAGPIIGICFTSIYGNKIEIDNRLNIKLFKILATCMGLSLVAFPLPGIHENKHLVVSSLSFAPLLWIVAIFAGLIQGIRQPAKG